MCAQGWLDRLARVGGGHGYAYSTGKSEKHIEEAGIDIESFEVLSDMYKIELWLTLVCPAGARCPAGDRRACDS